MTMTNMCMVYEKDRVLVQNKLDEDWNGVTFPGGHVEKGESFTESVIREVYEETGLTIRAPQLCGIKDWVNDDGSRYVVLLYKTDKFEGTVKSSEEGEVYWTTIEQMLKQKMVPDMEKLVDIFINDDLSEFYYYKEDGQWANKLL